jgi:hypothetical protein
VRSARISYNLEGCRVARAAFGLRRPVEKGAVVGCGAALDHRKSRERTQARRPTNAICANEPEPGPQELRERTQAREDWAKFVEFREKRIRPVSVRNPDRNDGADGHGP